MSSKLDASSALKDTQPSEHASLPTASRGRCDECRCIFVSQAELLRHCKAENHKCSQCICGESFSRPETLKRHVAAFIKKSGTRPDFTCSLCHRSGGRAFSRRDHLIQHLQVYHRGDPRAFRTLEGLIGRPDNYRYWDGDLYLCPRGCNEDCDEAWITSWGLGDSKPFNGQQHFDLHMRHMHEELPYACSYSGCSVSGATTNGFKTKSALEKHMSKEHRLAIEAQRREMFLPWCGERGCGLRLATDGATPGFRCLESDLVSRPEPHWNETGFKYWADRETQ